MNNKKDIWKKEVMQSIEGMNPAEPNDGLWLKLEKQLKNETVRINMVSKPKIWLSAASVIFLLGINIFILTQNNHSFRNKSEILVEAYQLNNIAEIQIP
jgi:hypothetical protein